MKHIWLFTFKSYDYCQGTKDTNYNDLRLISFTLPCDENEAKYHLIRKLNEDKIEFDEDSIKSLTYKVTNS